MAAAARLEQLATATRNDALEFAERTLKNIRALDQAQVDGADVHVVTHLANSLLGLIVFTVERKFVRFLQKVPLERLSSAGWPSWKFELGRSSTLGEIVYHLRNAVAHGRVWFSSDSRERAEVFLRFEDARRDSTVYWRAAIRPMTCTCSAQCTYGFSMTRSGEVAWSLTRPSSGRAPSPAARYARVAICGPPLSSSAVRVFGGP